MQSIIHIREAYTSISSNNLNRTMKILTAATVFVALPNVVFSMYGMNIKLPLMHEPWMFSSLVGVTLALLLLSYIVAKRKRIF
jgi:magnesium transporter